MVTFSFKKFVTLLNSHEIGKELDKLHVKYKLNYNKNGKVSVRVQTKKRMAIPKTMDNPKSLANMVYREQSEDIYTEPSDKVILGQGLDMPRYEKFPEYYGKAIYPATCKPNITRIKKWIVEVKLANMKDADLLQEMYGYQPTSYSIRSMEKVVNKFDQMLDSIAYKISRKIWYVGRKPSNMTDLQWDEATRDKRPSEGSYGGGDIWTNFKYDNAYEYSSGVM